MMKLCIGLWLATVGIGVTAQNPGPFEERKAQPGWDVEKAAQYLDDRMDWRFAKAKPLQTGQGKTACMTCHTVVPYVLARPALRRATRVNNPTPQEARLLDDTVHRVATYPAHQSIYDNKDKDSRGAEVVLNAFILASHEAFQHPDSQLKSTPGEGTGPTEQLGSRGIPAGRVPPRGALEAFQQAAKPPSDSTRQAFRELWEAQRPDGAWDWPDFGLEPYESKDAVFWGAALAATAVGTVPNAVADNQEISSNQVSRLRAYLQGKYDEQSLFNRAWLLLAATRLPDLLAPSQRDALMAELQKKQKEDGGWSLYELGPWRWSKASPPFGPRGQVDVELLSRSDGYATGLIAYVLRQAGLPSSHPSLRRAKDWLMANQQECQIGEQRWKCWRAYSLNQDHEHGGEHGELWPRMFMSDAATAFAVLALLSLD